jgi:SAM-dependent methyltransferase
MRTDPWLQRWLPLLLERAGARSVLEIGCGGGDDTAALSAAGAHVIAFDLSPARVATTRARVPAARISCQDVRAPFPDTGGACGAVVASLSLHYFGWTETVQVVSRIHAALHPGGLLLCRLNSTRDRFHGALGHRAIEPDYYDVRGQPKRFFDRAALERLFGGGWHALSVRELTTHKYLLPKVLWELVLERAA